MTEVLPPSGGYHIHIQPTKTPFSFGFKELWAYRELLFFLTWRDVKVRYKQTLLGASWAILQPFMTMVVFTIFFGKLANVSTDGLPGPVFYYSGLVAWTYFQNAVSASANSLVGNTALLTKIYFPRLAMPLSDVLGGLVDFLLSFVVLIGIMLVYGILPTVNIVWLPLFLLLIIITSLGVGIWLAAMNVQFRDVRYIVPFLTQIWMFITPVAYPSSLIENPLLRAIYGLNPMTGVVEGFRWALLGSGNPPGLAFLISSVVAPVDGCIDQRP